MNSFHSEGEQGQLDFDGSHSSRVHCEFWQLP